MRDEANLVRPNNLCQEKPRHVFITTKKVNNFHTYHVLILWCLNLNPSLWRICKYSGEPEYWVDIRETGEKGQERENKRQRVETSKDPKIRYLLFEKMQASHAKVHMSSVHPKVTTLASHHPSFLRTIRMSQCRKWISKCWVGWTNVWQLPKVQ